MQFSMLKLFQSKAPAKSPAPKTQAVAPDVATVATLTGNTGNAQARDAVKSVLAAFAQESRADALKIAAIGQKLMDTQARLLKATPSNAGATLSKSCEEIRDVLGALHALHVECKSTSIQLQKMSE